jgi:hypothetical protein
VNNACATHPWSLFTCRGEAPIVHRVFAIGPLLRYDSGTLCNPPQAKIWLLRAVKGAPNQFLLTIKAPRKTTISLLLALP